MKTFRLIKHLLNTDPTRCTALLKLRLNCATEIRLLLLIISLVLETELEQPRANMQEEHKNT